jgi:hypothetical protein
MRYPTLLVLGVAGAMGALLRETYANNALSGKPTSSSVLDTGLGGPGGALISIPAGGSTALSGTLSPPWPQKGTGYYSWDCDFSGGQIVMVWISDHLICHTNPPFGERSVSSTDGTVVNPLPGKAGQTWPILIHIYSASLDSTGKATSLPDASLAVRWAAQSAPLPLSATNTTVHTPIPAENLSAESSAGEKQRRALQDELKQGWNTWSYNMLGIVRLPHSISLTTALCKLSSQSCLEETHIEDDKASVRVGVFATDQSYWQFYLEYQGINVSISVSGGKADLHVIAEPINCAATSPSADAASSTPSSAAGANCSDFALVVLPRYMWFRLGTVSAWPSRAGSLQIAPLGVPGLTVIQPTTDPSTELKLPDHIATWPAHVAFSFGAGAVGLREGDGAPPSLQEVRQHVQAMRDAELDRYKAYGEFADVKEAVQAATLWNYIYHPAEYGPMLPVSRSWDFVGGAANSDWSYVIFDWDNIFASLMTSLDPRSKAIAYSNFIQVIRSKTAAGFVPNYSAGGSKSVDRTEPPVGAKVLLEMYKKYKDAWLVQLLFEDLLEWNTWFLTARAFGPLGLISLGSDTYDGYVDWSSGAMQGARYESGLDNSPMYDGEDYFVKNVSHEGAKLLGQMALYDVGMASMFVQEAEALATLAPIAGKPELLTELRERAAAQRSLIANYLWDDSPDGQIFTNRFWNGTFYRRISPTSFYALMAGAATDEQAKTMVSKWLLSPEHFCIAPQGDFAGNHDDCYWGLPSIQRADPAFPPLGYWRGYVWGPMAQLVYWSLQAYDHVPEVRAGRQALCKQMTALMLSQWRLHRHICENFSPHKTADDHGGDCSGTKFYHWGALAGMITLVEEGFY